jgi:hypothetical protein
MHEDIGRRQKPPRNEDEARTREARRVLEDYATQLREMLSNLRNRFN